MQRQVKRQPEHLGVAEKPDSKPKRYSHHQRQRQTRRPDSRDIIDNWPCSQRHRDRERIANRNVRKKVSALAHEEEPALRAALRRIEEAFEKFALVTDRTTEAENTRRVHPYLHYHIIHFGECPCLTTVLTSCRSSTCPKC